MFEVDRKYLGPGQEMVVSLEALAYSCLVLLFCVIDSVLPKAPRRLHAPRFPLQRKHHRNVFSFKGGIQTGHTITMDAVSLAKSLKPTIILPERRNVAEMLAHDRHSRQSIRTIRPSLLLITG